MWTGEQPVGHVVVLAGHLRLNPRSRVSAIDRGGMAWKGWDHAAEIAAARYDQTVALFAGLGGKDYDPRNAYPRPGAPNAGVEPVPEAATIADFSVGNFMKFMYG